MNVTVSDLVVKYMERLGIEVIFGMPGAHILPVYDCLYDSSIRSVLAKHEQGAAFMAGGYVRASGRIGACITTAGPGATNLVTGIANAYADKQPVLIITGEAPTYIFGKGGLQESSGEGGTIDQVALFKGITKYNKIVERTDYLENVLIQASNILLGENPGPVLLSFPFNVQKEMVDDAILNSIDFKHRIRPIHEGSEPVLALTEMIAAAKNPVIIAGYGCIKANAQEQVRQLSERMGIAVTSSLKGKGVVSERSPYALGSLGVTSYGPAYQYIREKSDLVIVLGAAFNERTSYVWDKGLLKDKTIAQVDNDYSQLGKVFKPDVAIQGDIKIVLKGVLTNLESRQVAKKDSMDVPSELVCMEQLAPESDAAIFKQRFALIETLFEKMEQYVPGNVMVFDDNIIFAQNFFRVSNGSRYYPNSGVSSLGRAIPAAIGARFIEDRPAMAILGDGGFQMCCMEIMTAVNYNIPLSIVMFNNSSMGLIRKNQSQQYRQRFINCDFSNPDYAMLAASFGIEHRKIENPAELDAVFSQLDFVNAINLIEVMIEKDLFPTYTSRR